MNMSLHRLEPTLDASADATTPPPENLSSETILRETVSRTKGKKTSTKLTVETPPQRLVRLGSHGPSLFERTADALRMLGYRSGLYRLKLRGAFPLRLLAAPADPWPGNAVTGAEIVKGQLGKAGTVMNTLAVPFHDVDASPAWFTWVHGFSWLRDLEAASPDIPNGAAITERLVKLWLADYAHFHPKAWAPEALGERLLMWIGHAPLLLSSVDQVYRSAVLTHMASGARHLSRTADRATDGLPRLKALCGLMAAGLVLPGREALASKALPAFDALLARCVLPDGGVASRAPLDALLILQHLIALRAVFEARHFELPASLLQAQDRLVPALRGLLLGDGRLTQCHGGGMGDAASIETALAKVQDAPRLPMHNAAHSGFQRLDCGKTIIVLDAGPPPPGRMSARAHAGSLAFEFSDGANRVVINCGSDNEQPSALPGDFLASLRATAAHSTLVLNDSNSTEIRSDGLLGKGVGEITAVRRENADGIWVDAAHDGYTSRLALVHRRRIFLSSDGLDVRGEDILEPTGRTKNTATPVPATVRFHLAPGVVTIPLQGNSGAALKLPNGNAWMFRCKGAEMRLEDSITIEDGKPRRCQQLVLRANITAADGGTINWLFQRGK
jgi:uncharacterized heparinase superfamily protein